MRHARFRLDALLRLREQELASAKGVLASHLRAMRQEADEKARCDALVAAGARDLSAKLTSGLDAGSVQVTSLAIDSSRARGQAADHRRRACEAPMKSAREGVEEAHRRVRALEILRERFLADARVRAARSDQRVLDEIGSRITQEERR